jgi:nicotinamide-nucleotide amidase
MVSSSHPGPAGSSPRLVRYELLTLGDELLLGLTANGHLSFVGSQLGRRGVLLQRNVTVTDEAGTIECEVRRSLAESDVVIVTGGLGPTVDDRTREAVAAVLGEKLVFDESIKQAIEARFAQLGRRVAENNLRQAYRFEHGEVLPNANGTAPGLWFERAGKVICLLPGPPNELQPMFTGQVVPRLERLGLLHAREAYVQIRTAGIGESALEVKLQSVLQPLGPALSVAFCAHQGHVDCRLSSPDGALDFARLEELAGSCARLLGEDFVCFGHDTLGRVCADLLRGQEKTVAVAEAATGGLLAQAFSDLCGACKFFAGGVVCCSQDSKMILLGVPECLMLQHGVASPECSVAMATGVAEALQADYGLAITGFASATGGAGGNPVGAIHVALHTPHGSWSRQLSYPGPRGTVKQRAVNAALDWLRRELIRSSRGATVIAQPGLPG